MASLDQPIRRPVTRPGAGTLALALTGVFQTASGVWLLAAPGSFYDAVATYAPRNDHFLRDVGTWNVGLGLAALVAAREPRWRAPMLAILAVQFALHAVSHLIDIDGAEPSSLGVSNFVLLALATVVLGALAVREHRRP